MSKFSVCAGNFEIFGENLKKINRYCRDEVIRASEQKAMSESYETISTHDSLGDAIGAVGTSYVDYRSLGVTYGISGRIWWIEDENGDVVEFEDPVIPWMDESKDDR